MRRYAYLTPLIVFDTLCGLLILSGVADYHWASVIMAAVAIAIATTSYYVFIVRKEPHD